MLKTKLCRTDKQYTTAPPDDVITQSLDEPTTPVPDDVTPTASSIAPTDQNDVTEDTKVENIDIDDLVRERDSLYKALQSLQVGEWIHDTVDSGQTELRGIRTVLLGPFSVPIGRSWLYIMKSYCW